MFECNIQFNSTQFYRPFPFHSSSSDPDSGSRTKAKNNRNTQPLELVQGTPSPKGNTHSIQADSQTDSRQADRQIR
jgi:hypothetical protein